MALTSKTKLARRTTRKPNEDPDPLGFAAKLEEAYQEWWRAFLRDNLIVKFKPAKLRGVVGAGTVRGEPVSFPLRSLSIPAMRLDSLVWSANWRRRSPSLPLRQNPTSNPTIRNTDHPSPAFSETEFVRADPKEDGANLAVADRVPKLA
jgi:hypothetical protein